MEKIIACLERNFGELKDLQIVKEGGHYKTTFICEDGFINYADVKPKGKGYMVFRHAVGEEVETQEVKTTIKEKIIQMEISNLSQRLSKMQQIGAPKILLETIPKQIDELKKGNIKIADKEQLLDMTYKNHKVLTGRGGKVYIQFNDSINYFPEGRYGKFITLNK